MTGPSISRDLAVVFCFSSDHPTKRARVAGFGRKPGEKRWTGTFDEDFGRRIDNQNLRGNVPDNRPLSHDAQAIAETQGWSRRRFAVTCPLCNRSVTVRGEKLDEILDVLAEAWNAHPDTDPNAPMVVPLSELAARV